MINENRDAYRITGETAEKVRAYFDRIRDELIEDLDWTRETAIKDFDLPEGSDMVVNATNCTNYGSLSVHRFVTPGHRETHPILNKPDRNGHRCVTKRKAGDELRDLLAAFGERWPGIFCEEILGQYDIGDLMFVPDSFAMAYGRVDEIGGELYTWNVPKAVALTNNQTRPRETGDDLVKLSLTEWAEVVEKLNEEAA